MNGALTGRHGGNLWHVEAARGGTPRDFSRYFAQASSELKDEMRKCIRIAIYVSPREFSIVPRYPSGVLRQGRLVIYYPHAIAIYAHNVPM